MIKVIDFCCGAGGLTRGLLDAGLTVVAGLDTDTRVEKTYVENNSPSRFIRRDIRTVNIRALRKELHIADGDPTLYAACTPCQPFSTLNTLRGSDNRRTLLLDFAAIIVQAPPDYIIVENVPGLNTAFGKDIYQEFRNILKSRGFQTEADMMDAKDYGVPQTRKRFILIASRHGKPTPPAFQAGTGFRTVADAIRDFPPIAHGETSKDYKNHTARKLPAHHLRIVEAIAADGGSRGDVSDPSILLKCHRENPKAHKDVFGRMAWDTPAPTLTCRCTDVYCGRFVHPEQHRGISLREAAALQSFGNDYEFFGGSLFEQARQVGNAVPVQLASLLGEGILRTHQGTTSISSDLPT